MTDPTPLPKFRWKDVQLLHDTPELEAQDLATVERALSPSPTGAPRNLSGIEAAAVLRYVRRTRVRVGNLVSAIRSLGDVEWLDDVSQELNELQMLRPEVADGD